VSGSILLWAPRVQLWIGSRIAFCDGAVFGFGCREWESILQGLKPLMFCWIERPKAEALGYLEATTDEWVLKSSVIEYGWPIEWVAL